MANFVPGQRWISETEPELGLGTIISFEYNRVTVLFIACGERRTYAADNAPLARVRFDQGERAESVEGWAMKVDKIEEKDGILSYHGINEDDETVVLEEVELNHYLQFNKPQDRLFIGQIDPTELFKLRYRTLLKMGELEQSTVRGLCGARTSLIPHQLYIAHEVAGRHAPRVLLADEVGLGKTIEAGLIMHHQVLTGRASRILVLVPEPLLHQWLVEMRRRFNLRFSLFDDERYDQHESGNPFLSEQLVLCGLAFFRDEPKRCRDALDGGWDLCVVDEAHHLEWSEEKPSEDYQFVEKLAETIPGLLLLTATPEQLGKRSHFARLRLLDPDRFYLFEEFLAEEKQYEPLAKLIECLTGEKKLDTDSLGQLKALVVNDRAEELLSRLDDPENSQPARQDLIRLILDRHGTGRILFRNTRATVKGFPERKLHPTPLPWPKQYDPVDGQTIDLDDLLFPESRYRQCGENMPWWRVDPRVRWLVDILSRLKPAKALVICARLQTAIDLEEALRVLGGIGAAVFHQGLSIVARDRAAAWFADEEEGAQVLVCSEIGSEGRNFQFAHHLVLFDLPLNPDQLEQRIGRLDRIGQRETIQIHVPWLENSAQALLFAWYHQGLDAFNTQCPAGSTVFAKLREELESLLRQPDDTRQTELIARSRKLNEEVLQELHLGRDRLLELNSCRRQEAETLVEQIRESEHRDDLWPYLDEVFECYGVNVEEHSQYCHILIPGDHMRVPNFPELPEDGVTVTLKRDIALAREDMLFLSWEHPMVWGAMDLILNNAYGNAAFGLVRHDDLDSGQLLLETVYLVECPAPKHLAAGRYMPQTVIRILVDAYGNDNSNLDFDSLVNIFRPMDREEVSGWLRGQRKLIERMLKQSEQTAQKQLPGIIAAGTKQMLDYATAELKRLSALRKVNPYVRQQELDHIKENTLELHGHIQSSRLRLDAVRILLTA
ncbi:MAG: RNA polymerase-associated protein RapA [Methylococcaceae bacterium]|nr:RNA polymerase-associated protein RapA [Methylococcaceae bacterium]